jgi:hypothetical protein
LDCGKFFRNSRRSNIVVTKQIWADYVFGKQTYRELADNYGLDKRTIRNRLEEYVSPPKLHHPRPTYLVVDATYFGERTEETSWCVVVARDPEKQEDLVWRFVETETTSVYINLRKELEELGYTIKSVTGDGFSGIRSAFQGIPYQMCHVHMERLVTRGTTKNPQTEAGQVLLALIRTLHSTTKKTFNKRLNRYIERYNIFLNEKTTNPLTGNKFWTHKQLRQATLSLINHKNYLFTYSSNTHISKSTNSIEGRFSHIKNITVLHRGLSRQQKQKLLHTLLLASTIAPSKAKLFEIL